MGSSLSQRRVELYGDEVLGLDRPEHHGGRLDLVVGHQEILAAADIDAVVDPDTCRGDVDLPLDPRQAEPTVDRDFERAASRGRRQHGVGVHLEPDLFVPIALQRLAHVGVEALLSRAERRDRDGEMERRDEVSSDQALQVRRLSGGRNARGVEPNRSFDSVSLCAVLVQAGIPVQLERRSRSHDERQRMRRPYLCGAGRQRRQKNERTQCHRFRTGTGDRPVIPGGCPSSQSTPPAQKENQRGVGRTFRRGRKMRATASVARRDTSLGSVL